MTGIPVSNQIIKLYQNEDDTQPIAVLDDDSRPLGYYSVGSGQFLKVNHSLSIGRNVLIDGKVEDTNPSATLTGQFTDLSQVEKFELTKEEYEKRNGKLLES